MGWLDRIFGRKKPEPPKVTGGNRGIAAGSRKKPKLGSYQERIKKGHEEIPDDESTAFVYEGTLLFVHSTNVVAAQYFPDAQKMMVEFGDGRYLYSNVSVQEAISFVQAQSKGMWLWRNFRVLGSKTAHRKPYVKLS